MLYNKKMPSLKDKILGEAMEKEKVIEKKEKVVESPKIIKKLKGKKR